MKFIFLFCFFYGFARCAEALGHERLDHFLQSHPQISQFFTYVRTSPFLRSAISWKQGTLFVPTNEAISAYVEDKKRITNTTLLYHFCNFQMPVSELEQEKFVTTELTGNPPIWISKTSKGIFLNDARFITGNFHVAIEERGRDPASVTIVHFIDRVLEPSVPGSIESLYLHNPDAGKYLEHISSYDSDGQLATIYRGIVSKKEKLEIYKQAGFQTYFIPVDEAFKLQKIHSNVIDSEVIYGHILPKGVFLRTIEGGEEYETYKPPASPTPPPSPGSPPPFSVVVTFEKTVIGGQDVWLVNSDNRHGDEKHRKGVVQAEIIKGNIPVKNGVVHLISKPLVVIDMNVFQTLEWYATKQHIRSMGKFWELYRKLQLRGMGEEIRSILQGQNSPHGVTLFVPSNEAIELSSELRENSGNMELLAEVLKTHILQEMVTAEDMVEHSKMKRIPFQVQSAHPGRKLFFSSFTKDGNRTIHVEGGGVNATVVHADFGATNGFIHIIDRVLGFPHQTIEEKLRTHPMLQSTYHLWRKSGMSDRLNETNYPITFLAPSEAAWLKVRRSSDQAYHNFFQSASLSDMVPGLLDRHLIIEQGLSIQELLDLSRASANKTVSKGMKGNWTVSRYPIKTFGERGYIKVNMSKTLLRKDPQVLSTTTPTPQHGSGNGKQKSLRQQHGEHGEKDASHYYVYWNRMWAHVIRTNVNCTNGIIHIIDDVLMDNEEILVAAAPALVHFSTFTIGVLCLLNLWV